MSDHIADVLFVLYQRMNNEEILKVFNFLGARRWTAPEFSQFKESLMRNSHLGRNFYHDKFFLIFHFSPTGEEMTTYFFFEEGVDFRFSTVKEKDNGSSKWNQGIIILVPPKCPVYLGD